MSHPGPSASAHLSVPPRIPGPRPAEATRSPLRWRIPVLLWLIGGFTVLTAVFRIAMIIEGLTLDVLPEDYEGAHYLDHLFVASAHMVPGIVFLLVGPLQFSASLRRRYPRWHRRAGWVFVGSGLALGLTGVWMNRNFPPIGGVMKFMSTQLFGITMLVAIVLAMIFIIRGNVRRHRVWMIRAFGIGLAPATQRLLLIPIFVALGEAPDHLIDVGMTAGWCINIIVAEIIIRRGRNAQSKRARSR